MFTFLRPSVTGIIALGLLAVVGIGVECLPWRTFQRRWAGDRDAHPTSDISSRTHTFWSGAVLWVAFVLALAAKGVGLGYDALTTAAAIAIGIGALLLTGWLRVRYSGRG